MSASLEKYIENYTKYGLPEELIRRIFSKHQGKGQEAIEELNHYQDQIYKFMEQYLLKGFDHSNIIKCFVTSGFDIKKTAVALDKMSSDRKFKIAPDFSETNPEMYRDVLQNHDFMRSDASEIPKRFQESNESEEANIHQLINLSQAESEGYIIPPDRLRTESVHVAIKNTGKSELNIP